MAFENAWPLFEEDFEKNDLWLNWHCHKSYHILALEEQENKVDKIRMGHSVWSWDVLELYILAPEWLSEAVDAWFSPWCVSF